MKRLDRPDVRRYQVTLAGACIIAKADGLV
jgi:hypothetical protein